MNSFRSFLEAVQLALRSILRQKRRSFLTALGIAVGIASVVTVTALSRSARESVQKQISQLGSNALMVFPRSARPSGVKSATGGSKLSRDDASALEREGLSIKAAAPFYRASIQVVREGSNASASAVGTTLPYFEIRNWNLARGELWTPSAETLGARVAILGSETAANLFGKGDPVGQRVRIGRHSYEVLGVLEEKGQSPFGQNQDEIVLMPMQTMVSRITGGRRNEVHAIIFSAVSSETTLRAKSQAEGLLRQRHGIREGDDDDFMVRSQAEFQAMQEAIYSTLTLLLLGAAAVSLTVGGVGIMNIMLVSVAQRTREIGIRVAVGAHARDIMLQFLTEAVMLCGLGGLLGIGLGYAVLGVLQVTLGWIVTVHLPALFIALGTSTAVGLVFGFFPARNAARLDPVVALGRE